MIIGNNRSVASTVITKFVSNVHFRLISISNESDREIAVLDTLFISALQVINNNIFAVPLNI